jgi:hypothetical protein
LDGCDYPDYNDGEAQPCGFYGCIDGSSFIDCTATPSGSPCDTIA